VFAVEENGKAAVDATGMLRFTAVFFA